MLAIRAWLQIVQIPSGSALLALGAPRWLAYANALRLASVLLFVALGYRFGGFAGALIGLAASELPGHAACVIGARRFGLRALGAEFASTLGFAIAGATGVWAAASIEVAGGNGIMQLAGALLAAVAAWFPVAGVLLRADWPRFSRAGRVLRS